MTTLVKRIADATGYTPAQIRGMTLYQGALWLADGEYIADLNRWRVMTPRVRKIMRQIEGFQIGA